jgi:hypothetical protein
MREISAEKLSYVIAKAREANELRRGTEGVVDIAGDDGCAAARAELAVFIEAMDEDEQCELIALCWIGRGKFTREEWESALVEARAHLKQPTADYLLRNPKLAPHLESGLAEFNLTVDALEGGRRH